LRANLGGVKIIVEVVSFSSGFLGVSSAMSAFTLPRRSHSNQLLKFCVCVCVCVCICV
jgi:hypothetical protein